MTTPGERLKETGFERITYAFVLKKSLPPSFPSKKHLSLHQASFQNHLQFEISYTQLRALQLNYLVDPSFELF